MSGAATIYGVAQTRDRMVYLVNSDTPGQRPWRVDLEQFGGWGSCECPSYRMARAGEMSKVERMRRGDRSEGIMCKHMRRAHLAHSVWLNQRILAVADKDKPAHRSEAWRHEA